jgi:L-ribulose-5-phosphate 3-epimerase
MAINSRVSRREFLQVSSAGTLSAAFPVSTPVPEPPAARGPFRSTLCLFSKPVPQLNWRELAEAAKGAGFGGVDLTVRREGHVLPERVVTDLPQAVAAIRDAGLEVPMITTELLAADDRTAEPILSTASKLSIGFVKPGYYHYKLVNVLAEVDRAGEQFRGLVELAGKHGIQVGYHNHPEYIGAPIWDIAKVIEPLEPRWCGFYFDLSQATMDGSVSGWKIAANLVMPRLKMVAVKDFIWSEAGPHDWQADPCPLPQGVSRWKEFLPMLAESDFHGPISLHEEYRIPDVSDRQGIALSRATVPGVMSAAKKDLEYLKLLLREAYEQG